MYEQHDNKRKNLFNYRNTATHHPRTTWYGDLDHAQEETNFQYWILLDTG